MTARRSALLLALVLGACATGAADRQRERVERPAFDRILSFGGRELSGWLGPWGELTIYDSPAAQDLGLVYPYCVSGVPAPGIEASVEDLKGKKIRIRFEKFEFDNLPYEDSPVPTRRVLKGEIVANQCDGRYVVYVTAIEIAD